MIESGSQCGDAIAAERRAATRQDRPTWNELPVLAGPAVMNLPSPADALAWRPYDESARHYDAFVEHPGFRDWIRSLESVSRSHGRPGPRLLDVGCGTGNSLAPLLGLGLDLAGCDPSPPMLGVARRKLGRQVKLTQAALPCLPKLGQFDVAWALNDVINLLLDPGHVAPAIASLAANLAPGGLVILDANTPATYSGFFAGVHTRRRSGRTYEWRGATASFSPGGLCEADLSVTDQAGATVGVRHVQRHHPAATLEAGFSHAGLQLVDVFGQDDLGRRQPRIDFSRDPKVIYVARKPQ